MKKALSLLALLALTVTASAVEYVMVKAGEERGLDASSLVEVTLIPSDTAGAKGFSWNFAGGGAEDYLSSEISKVPLTGITKIRAIGSTLTLKITPKSEINVVAPGTVLVLPENVTGNYDVIIESSDDLVSWEPFFSQTVSSETASKFFRTRVTKTPTP